MLILSNQNDCTNIGLESEILLDLIENTTDYQSIKITIQKDCCIEYTQELDLDEGFTDLVYVSEDNSMILIAPEFIETTIFGDSIFKVSLDITKKDGTNITNSNCFFFDCDISCTLFTKSLEIEDNTINNDMVLIHYALTQGSNCGCNCENLCSLLKRLKELLSIEEEDCNEC